MKERHFATEADLCARFIGALKKDWTPYPETAGWDILLVRNADGFQIGVQAKLRFNLDVVNQALEDNGTWSVDRAAPDCRAVLVPYGEGHGLDKICDYIGLTVIRVHGPRQKGVYGPDFMPTLPTEAHGWISDDWHEWCPAKRHKLPEYVPDVVAGSSAPVQLTQWKIAAMKIAITLEARGYVTRSDFKTHKIDHRRWVPQGWLTTQGGRMQKGEAFPNFKVQHPKVYEEIRADAEKWMPKPEPQLV